MIGALKIVLLEKVASTSSRTLFFRIRTKYCTISILKTIDRLSVAVVRPKWRVALSQEGILGGWHYSKRLTKYWLTLTKALFKIDAIIRSRNQVTKLV